MPGIAWWKSRAKEAHATRLPAPRFNVQFLCGKLTAAGMKFLGEEIPESSCPVCLVASGRPTFRELVKLVQEAYPLIFREYNGVDPKNWIQRAADALRGLGIKADEWA